jgi:ribosomal protein L40E
VVLQEVVKIITKVNGGLYNMLLETFIQIDIHNNQAKYYRSLGYILDIPSYYSKNNCPFYTTLVHVDDILPKSKLSVTRICNTCEKLEVVNFYNHNFEICHKCANQKPSHHQHCEKCGKDLGHWNKVVKLCKNCNKGTNSGSNHYAHGKTRKEILANAGNTLRTKLISWAREVKLRDGCICQVCGTSDGKMIGHHLYDKVAYPDISLDVNNGVCMCMKCHLLFHNYHQNKPPATEADYIKFKEGYNNEHC